MKTTKIIALAILSLALFSCKKPAEETTPLVVDFTISSNPCNALEEVTFTASVSGGKTPYTYEWRLGDEATLKDSPATWTPQTNGTYRLVLKVTDASGASAERTKNLVVNAAQIAATGEVTLKWVGQLRGYTSMTTPAVADDGSVYTLTRNSNTLYKFSKDGTKVWEKEIIPNIPEKTLIYGTPSIDTDGTVFVPAGSTNGDGVLVAFNPDGTVKWRFKDFYANNTTPAPSLQGVTAAIGDKNVYVGNCGTTGSIVSVSKADGKRVNYLKNEAGGGPAGGARAGTVITKNGFVNWSGGMYGIFGAKQSDLDTAGEGAMWAWQTGYASGAPTNPKSMVNSTLAILTVNGKTALSGTCTDQSDPAGRTRVFVLDATTGEDIAQVYIDDCNTQDQGGVAVTEDNLIVASLKYTLGQDNGGVAFVDPAKGTMVSHFRIGENVAGAAAIDNDGNVHFATEAGNYYVLKLKDGQPELLVKKNLTELIKGDARYKDAFGSLQPEGAKVWSGLVIGDDGTVYIQFTENEDRVLGGIAAIGVDYCKGPSTVSPWPMMGQNRRHTSRQK